MEGTDKAVTIWSLILVVIEVQLLNSPRRKPTLRLGKTTDKIIKFIAG